MGRPLPVVAAIARLRFGICLRGHCCEHWRPTQAGFAPLPLVLMAKSSRAVITIDRLFCGTGRQASADKRSMAIPTGCGRCASVLMVGYWLAAVRTSRSGFGIFLMANRSRYLRGTPIG